MPRAFKFSFPLPGSRQSAEDDASPDSWSIPSNAHDDSPLSDPGSKAERVLGTSDPVRPHIKKKMSRRALKSKPSFMSVTISEAESDDNSGKDGFPFPGMPRSKNGSRRPSFNLRTQSSSPLLGDRFLKGSPGTDSLTTDASSPQHRFHSSSSTLRSYYDPGRSPLSISQQTSASSARDMALRKGCPIVSSPLSRNISESSSSAVLNERIGATVQYGSGASPATLDISSYFPKPDLKSNVILSPNKISKSPSQVSLSSNGQQANTPHRQGWWKKRKGKEADHKSLDALQQRPTLHERNVQPPPPKTDPMKSKVGARYWFDGIEEDNGLDMIDFDGAGKPTFPAQSWNKHLDGLQENVVHQNQEIDKDQGRGVQLPPPPPHSEHTTTNSQQQKQHCKIPEDHHAQNFGILRSRSNSAGQGNLSPSGEGRVGSIKADLQDQSFLELSSSEDESETSVVAPYQYRRHRIRDSIDQTAIGDEVLVYNAERVRPAKPQPVHHSLPRRSTRGSETIPPVPKIPARPQLQKRVSSMRWRESTSMKPVTAHATEDSNSSGRASIVSQASSRIIIPDSNKKRFGQKNKMMVVTLEEEQLLEAMRNKRTSIHQNAFADGHAKSIHSAKSSSDRPKTAGADSKTSYSRSTSPLPSIAVPPKSVGFTYPTALSDYSAFGDPFPSPEISRRSKAPPVRFPPPKSSPTSSLSPSDMLQSTPRSGLSPITPPPPDRDFLEMYVQGVAISPSRAQHIAQKSRHERKETGSSSVVMFDGGDQRGPELDDEDAITGWAMDRW
ncbi:MAG: hypothetical protein LQ342_003267 [Letrouitia transgressa]|nr:MAG: hypothetical protein LQ342_003267 [Letrouitia transgressa]